MPPNNFQRVRSLFVNFEKIVGFIAPFGKTWDQKCNFMGLNMILEKNWGQNMNI